MSALIEQFKLSSGLYGGNAAFIEDLYERFLQDPTGVPAAWRERFYAMHQEAANEVPHAPIRENFVRLARERRFEIGVRSAEGLTPVAAEKQAVVLRLINSYRYRGHQAANLDALHLGERPIVPDLDLAFHNLTQDDMGRVFHTGSLYAPDRMALKDIYALINEVYTGSVGSEYMHITDTREKRWIQKRLEGYRCRPSIEAEGKRWILTMLTAAEGMERYLHTRYVGQKRFSLEGGESLMPMLDELVQRAGSQGVEELVIGMAHRGRLNVLINLLGKPPGELFKEFEGKVDIEARQMAGDVKYHQGYSADIPTPGGPVHVTLGFNPSHLEIVDPVIEGSVRARQERRRDAEREKVLPVLIHGDSAFAGQGVVMETLNLSQTRGYGTGGTVHIIINNQIGFTTSNPLDTRSTLYCTDVAKMVQAPVFHVNGDDPEAVIFVTRVALDFRREFHKDVIIDMVCYRRHGHNEADEPAVTQPVMYHKIRSHPTVRAIYAGQLVDEGVISDADAKRMQDEYRAAIENGQAVPRAVQRGLPHPFAVDWSPYKGIGWDHPTDTRFPRERLQELALKLLEVPPGFELHARLEKIWSERRKMATGDQMADWGFAEVLAYATLVDGGYPVRLSGQDSGRGTFFHRHVVLHNQVDGATYVPLQYLKADQVEFLVIDSVLSEEAVLAYEYGYATAEPNTLTLWEAQFGDFANGAQVVIDQFITSAETKWRLLCGLVMLLPHGLEGQGAEHSSARLERYLQLCAEHNIQVCVPTSPAQMFHLLRRQMIRPYRKPLVVMTPKSLLRHRLATSSLEELAEGHFQPLIGEVEPLDPAKVERVVLCSGKVYYELLEARRARGLQNVALMRLEQVYPFPNKDFDAAMEPFSRAKEIIWCQEEPQNQGAWDLVKYRLNDLVHAGKQIYFVGRPASAAPAVGYLAVHLKQQERLINEALSGRINPLQNRRIPL